MHLVENPSGGSEALPRPEVTRKHTGPLLELKLGTVVQGIRDAAVASHMAANVVHMPGLFRAEVVESAAPPAPQTGGYEDVAPAA
jgi:hypothetical protein